MPRPLKRRRRPPPKKVTVRYVDPKTLRSGGFPKVTREASRVEPDYFQRKAALHAAHERRDALNAALRPGDTVRLPEGTGDLIWAVRSVDTTTHRLGLVTTIFSTQQSYSVPFRDAEPYST
jgi:hypothetical protein